jgi:hypothetical protein
LVRSESERMESAIKRFDNYVVKNGDFCWDWIGGKFTKGYGCMRFPTKAMYSHRISWIIYNGPIPEGLHVLHTCDVKECTNPKHLFLGTNADNMRDKAKKGRASRLLGSKCPRAVLNEKKVGEIKTLLKKGMRLALIASNYKVSSTTIDCIKYGRTWKTVKSS